MVTLFSCLRNPQNGFTTSNNCWSHSGKKFFKFVNELSSSSGYKDRSESYLYVNVGIEDSNSLTFS